MWSLPHRAPELHELRLLIGRVISGFTGGLHRSVIKDKGAELLNLRPYELSDPLKQVDWMASARLSEDDVSLVTKEFAPERQISVCILADEHITMTAPLPKAMCAQSLVQLFALSAMTTLDRCFIIGFNGAYLVASDDIRNEDALNLFLRATDRVDARRGLRTSANSLVAHFDEIKMENTLLVVITDLSRLDKFPYHALRTIDAGKTNISVVSIVLDEWSGFLPSDHLLSVRHPETGETVAMDLREGGEFAQQVAEFHYRLREHRERGRSFGMKVFPIVLSHEKPLVQFARDWLRFSGE